MRFSNVPVNGWPQIKDLEKLDALAKQIEDMPTFSSSDRAWLDEWEDKLPELPEDPETDGVKVLTATTESGETVKSWEDPAASGITYSTTEQKTGDKWIDNKDIYCKVVNLQSTLEVQSQTWTDTGVDSTDIDTLLNVKAYDANSVNFSVNAAKMVGETAHIGVMQFRSTQIGINRLVLWYTKSTT